MDTRSGLLLAFGSAVRQRRETLSGRSGDRLSQEELAERAGLHRTYVGSVERGERNVALINVDRLARALGLSASELMSEAERLRDRQS